MENQKSVLISQKLHRIAGKNIPVCPLLVMQRSAFKHPQKHRALSCPPTASSVYVLYFWSLYSWMHSKKVSLIIFCECWQVCVCLPPINIDDSKWRDTKKSTACYLVMHWAAHSNEHSACYEQCDQRRKELNPVSQQSSQAVSIFRRSSVMAVTNFTLNAY